ncbi:antitoxin of toxin-antitoxin stability system [Castellaniella sp. MT123]|uniref:antitoxin of toxin-antitoxin stability system n=1 Tax=Castellaniella sp. MT123 TaxID=3140381 RepID=UPI0031F3E727
MSTKAVFTMKLEAELRDEFMAATMEDDRPASQVVRELMRGYLDQRRRSREYDEYLHQKVEAARVSMREGRGRSNEDVEAAFAAKRRQLMAG